MSLDRPIDEDDLQAYVDRRLDPARLAEVEHYLDRHPEEAARIKGYAGQRDALRAALAPFAAEPVPPELNLLRLIEAIRRPRPRWRSAAAAVVMLGLGGTLGWSLHGAGPSPSTGIAALAREAAYSYQVFGPDRTRPVELKAADRAELLHWISDRLHSPVVLPDLAPSGYRFMGGRLVATSHGPAGLFLYDDDRGTRLAMLVRPMDTEKDASMSEHSQGAIAGYAWADKGIGYSLVGPASPDILHPLADEVRKQVSRSI